MQRNPWVIGRRRDGSPIYSIAGGDFSAEELDGLEQLLKRQAATLSGPSAKAQAVISGGNRQTEPDEAIVDTFFRLVAAARSPDAETQAYGKTGLQAMGSAYVEASEKAVLGTDGPSGGFLAPPVVRDVLEADLAASPLRELLGVVPLRLHAGAELPLENFAPGPAVVVGRGQTKPNESFTLANYTATLYTLAKIVDAGNQWLRQTGGSGERLIRSRMARSFIKGEADYILNGAGTTEPLGILTAIAALGGAFVTSHTPSDSTVAGSVRSGIAKMLEALADRDVDTTGVLVHPGTLARAARQGDDQGGFWVTGSLRDVGLDIPIRTSSRMPKATAIAGDLKSLELYVGEDFRIDSSTEAGDRFDKNLTGFRAEEEIGFNATPGAISGRIEVCTTLVT